MKRIQLDILESLGADYQEIMERFLENEDFYLKLLEKFSKKPDIYEIEAALDKEDFEGAFRLAHSIKGGSANMGLTYLSEAMVELTDALRNPPYDMEKIRPLYSEAKANFEDTMAQVEIVLEGGEQ